MPVAWLCLELFLIVDLVLLSIVDLEVWLIPIETTLYIIPFAIAAALIFPGDLHPSKTIWYQSGMLNGLIDSLSGMAIGAGFLWAVGFLVAILFFVRNTLRGIKDPPPEAMGMGDVHMLAMFGALAGWKLALMAILIGVMIGAVTGVSKIMWNNFQRKRLGDKWVPPPPPTFDLPEDNQPYEPMLWPLLFFGTLLLGGSAVLNERFKFMRGGAAFDELIPFWLLVGIGVLLMLAFPFYQYLKSTGRTRAAIWLRTKRAMSKKCIKATTFLSVRRSPPAV